MMNRRTFFAALGATVVASQAKLISAPAMYKRLTYRGRPFVIDPQALPNKLYLANRNSLYVWDNNTWTNKAMWEDSRR